MVTEFESEPVAPIANNDTVGPVEAGEIITFTVTDNDVSNDGELNLASVVIVSAPSAGTATVNASGTITYLNTGTTATTDTLTYTVADTEGQISNEATVTITVTEPSGGGIAESCGKGMAFDGINDWINIPDLRLANDFTIEGWFKLAPGFDYRDSLFGQEGSGPDIHFTAGKVRLYAYGIRVTAKTPLIADTWAHIAITRSGTNLTIYINGVKDATGRWNGILNVKAIGRGNRGFVNGMMDEIRIWNLARTETEIGNSYDTSVDPDTDGLLGYWNFKGEGQTITDTSSNGNHGTLGANATNGTDDPVRLDTASPLIEICDDATAPVISNVQTVVSDSTATISWDTDEPATSNVAYGLDNTYSATPETNGDFVTQHSLTITGLTELTDYHFQISSVDASGNASSEADDVYTTEATPDTTAPVISNIQTVVSDSTATISWDTDEPATSNVTYGLDNTYSATPETNGDFVTQHSLTITGLTELTDYHFQISSEDASGNSISSADQIVTTEASPLGCTTPWGENIAHQASVSAYQQATVAFGNTCVEETQICDNGVLSGGYTHQQCQVLALQPPQNLIATANNGAIELSWSPVINASSYNLHYSEDVTFPTDQTMQMNSVQSPYNLTGLSNDVIYYLAVTAVSNSVESLFSNEVSATPKAKGKLNDTGITWAGNYPSGNNTDCLGVEISAQDCSHGRDAQALAGTLSKIGAGSAGFDFTKLDANGSSLAANETSWSCVKDNHTGLIWEAKTDNDDIHDKDNRYRWGGVTALGDGTVGTYYNDWTPLVTGSNSEALCGFSDWRVPTINELTTLLDLSRVSMAIDMAYFPNTSYDVWSSSPSAGSSVAAWYVHFYDGNSNRYVRYGKSQVRLVRSGQ